VKIYCDSSTKEACIVIEGQEPISRSYPKPVTNNTGEYIAVILALMTSLDRNLTVVEILTDSQLVVNQVGGAWQCRKKHLLPLRDKARALLTFANLSPRYIYSLSWIPREENLAGKVLG